jgi:hypothetical protein
MRAACEVLAFLVVLIWVLSDRGNHETGSAEAIYDLGPEVEYFFEGRAGFSQVSPTRREFEGGCKQVTNST